MFESLGDFAYRHRRLILSAWLLGFVLAIPVLLRVEEPLKVGGFSSPDTESSRASAVLQERLSAAPSTMVVVFTSDTLQAADRMYDTQVRYALQPVLELPNVVSVIYPADDPMLVSDSGRTAYALIGLDIPAEEAQRDVDAFKAALRTPPDLEVAVAGAPAFYADIETLSQRDLRRAELIALPLALITLVIVFGSVVAALVPLAAGGLGVAAVLVILYAVAHVTEMSIFVLNLATMLGLGLAVDYSLFVTSRYREELRRNGGDVRQAVVTSSGTAGRAIFYSGFTVLIGLAGLALFDFMFLRSVGISGVIVVFFSVAAALTLLPAMLGVIGTRIDRIRLAPMRPTFADAGGGGFWARLSHWVMRRPVAVLVPTVALLLALGFPFVHVRVSSPDATILPRSLPSRQAFDLMVEEFGPGEISPFVITLVSDDDMFTDQNLGTIYDFTERLAHDPRVAHVKSIAPVFDGVSRQQAIELMKLQPELARLGLGVNAQRLISEDSAVILAYSRDYAIAEDNKELLSEIRSWQLDGDLAMLVGGATAEIVDVVDKMYGQFPYAVLLIVVATYIVLLVLFRSVVLPIKAIILNTMSIVASYGAVVFIFQDGHFSRLLRFAPLGFVEASLPIIMFCVLFGLSMDYEVFLLSRIREEWERTGDNTAAIATGLQRSGKIITSAALIVVVVIMSFASAEVILIKALGVGIAIAVFVDATIIRALLVPATMRLMGKWNWWLPSRLDHLLPGYGHRESSRSVPESQ